MEEANKEKQEKLSPCNAKKKLYKGKKNCKHIRTEEQQVIMIKVLLYFRYVHDFKRRLIFFSFSIYFLTPFATKYKHDDQNLAAFTCVDGKRKFMKICSQSCCFCVDMSRVCSSMDCYESLHYVCCLLSGASCLILLAYTTMKVLFYGFTKQRVQCLPKRQTKLREKDNFSLRYFAHNRDIAVSC